MKTSIAAIIVCVASACFADEKTLSITADVGICAHPDERTINTGGRSHVRIKGIEHYYLFDFDTKEIAGWEVTSAVLHLKLASGHLQKLAVCTVPLPWVEGTAGSEPQKGSSCYTHVNWPDKPWTDWGGTMLDATFNNPYMFWRQADVAYEPDGKWMKITIAPELVQAVAAGLSHGLVLSEEKGQTRENHDVFTREQANAKPYLVVKGEPAGKPDLRRALPKAEPWPQAASFKGGAVSIDVGDPFPKATVAALGHRVTIAQTGQSLVTFREPRFILSDLPSDRELTVSVETFVGPHSFAAAPIKVKPSPPLAIPTVPLTSKPPASLLRQVKANGWTIEVHPASAKLAPDSKPLKDAADYAVPTYARNSWASFTIALFPPEGKAEDVSIELPFLKYKGPQREAASPLHQLRLFRQWYMTKDKSWQAEGLVPLKAAWPPKPGSVQASPTEPFAIPWKENKVSSQVCQPILVDVWIPRDAAPGPYEGKLVVMQGGREVASVALSIVVAPAVLPDEYKIVGDCNTYDMPAGAMGVKEKDAAAFMDMNLKYYRLAHEHRMTLNVLPYSQAGDVHSFGAPAVSGTGPGLKIDWSAWDAAYGPLLTGEAFGAKSGYVGPGQGVPIRHMYLSLHENWPIRLADAFEPWPPPKDYEKLLQWLAKLPPIDKCLEGKIGYQAIWANAVYGFEKHIGEKNYLRTQYQIYLNDKLDFRDPKRGGRGISLWLLDEPMFSDDFLALAYFGRATREARRLGTEAKGQHNVKFRVDISRPTHQRNWLDGVVDLNVCGGQLYSQRWWIDYRKRTFDEEYWNYNMPPSFSGDNLPWTTWPILSYCWGATGTLPWQTIAKDSDWDAAEATALMYPGKRFGIDAPLPSLRMKAWRDGLQDAELLRMLREKMKWNELQLRAFVGQVCGLDGWKEGANPPEDSAIVTFKWLTPEKLDAIRRAALGLLAETK